MSPIDSITWRVALEQNGVDISEIGNPVLRSSRSDKDIDVVPSHLSIYPVSPQCTVPRAGY